MKPLVGYGWLIVTLSGNSDAWTKEIKTHTEDGEINEPPGHDGHRKNLLAPDSCHNQIGISILLDRQNTAWVSEDITGRYVNCPPLPLD
jgi:hypothetical protein